MKFIRLIFFSLLRFNHMSLEWKIASDLMTVFFVLFWFDQLTKNGIVHLRMALTEKRWYSISVFMFCIMCSELTQAHKKRALKEIRKQENARRTLYICISVWTGFWTWQCNAFQTLPNENGHIHKQTDIMSVKFKITAHTHSLIPVFCFVKNVHNTNTWHIDYLRANVYV